MKSMKFLILALLLALLFVVVRCDNQAEKAEDSFWDEVIDYSETEKDDGFRSAKHQQVEVPASRSSADFEDFAEFENEYGLKVDSPVHTEQQQPIKDTQSSTIDAGTTTAAGTLDLNTTESSGWKFFSLPKQEHFYVEIAAVTVLIAYTIMFLIGRKQNQNIAKAWATAFSSDFCNNFSSAASDSSFQITKDSASEFRYYATGRVHCSGILATLQMKSRHDMLFWLYGYIYGEDDILTIEVPLSSEMEDYVLAITPRLKQKEYKQNYADLRNYASTVPVEALESLAVLSDSPEMVHQIVEGEGQSRSLAGGIAPLLNQYSRSIIAIHISDCYQPYIDPQNPYAPPVVGNAFKGRVLKVVLRLPDTTDAVKMKADLGKLMSLVFLLIDVATTTKLSSKAQEKVARVRASLRMEQEKMAQKNKQENIIKKRQDKKKKEEEEKRLAVFNKK